MLLHTTPAVVVPTKRPRHIMVNRSHGNRTFSNILSRTRDQIKWPNTPTRHHQETLPIVPGLLQLPVLVVADPSSVSMECRLTVDMGVTEIQLQSAAPRSVVALTPTIHPPQVGP